MKRCVEIFACAAVAVFLFACGAAAQAPAPTPGPNDLSRPFFVPVGEGADGVSFPYWENGRLKRMFFRAEKLEHKDLDNVQMQNAKITTYDDGQKTDLILLLPVSTFNLKTRMLTSDKPFVLKKADFEMMGDALQLNTATRQATITGNVKMIIFNVQDPTKKKEEKKEEKKPEDKKPDDTSTKTDAPAKKADEPAKQDLHQ